MALYQRIKKNRDYRKVYRYGQSVADRNLVMFILTNKLRFKRFGFTVSKKVGNAVVRNRVRRLLKEACRLNIDKFSETYDYVFLARNAAAGKNYRDIEDSLLRLLKKIIYPRG